MMAPLYDGQQVGAAVDDVTGLVNQELLLQNEYLGRRKPYSEGALAGPIAFIRSRTIHARRDRKKTRA
jgi:hypothetical protein